jgi:hypothetical protein
VGFTNVGFEQSEFQLTRSATDRPLYHTKEPEGRGARRCHLFLILSETGLSD